MTDSQLIVFYLRQMHIIECKFQAGLLLESDLKQLYVCHRFSQMIKTPYLLRRMSLPNQAGQYEAAMKLNEIREARNYRCYN